MARGEHVLDGQRLARPGDRVELRPPPRGDRDLGELLARRAVLVHVARGGERVAGRPGSIGSYGASYGMISWTDALRAADRALGRAVGDQRDVAQPGGDRRRARGRRGPRTTSRRSASSRCSAAGCRGTRRGSASPSAAASTRRRGRRRRPASARSRRARAACAWAIRSTGRHARARPRRGRTRRRRRSRRARSPCITPAPESNTGIGAVRRTAHAHRACRSAPCRPPRRDAAHHPEALVEVDQRDVVGLLVRAGAPSSSRRPSRGRR